ncbi:GNAT family N-acetyltransferase [Rhodanobacter hydrolyticus]|uniref:GNAT family N-acetyltransferase n=1 Tax=Rhodanobacter hydrolyticus TaxID=2250595 RepID=A0ABW8J594_9GAMM
MKIVVDDLTHPEVHALLREHVAGMHAHSPPENVFALDLSRLKVPEVMFWTAWDEAELLGCGAMKELDATHGEVKSMRTAAGHLRKGVARKILDAILAEAGRRGYSRVSLETGSTAAFVPAHTLYAQAGFVRSGPFGDYSPNDFSVFFTRTIGQA